MLQPLSQPWLLDNDSLGKTLTSKGAELCGEAERFFSAQLCDLRG
jgi:hypothetical protein